MGKPIIFPGALKRLKQFMTGKYIEETNTASQNIPAGKYVIWKNQMCQAKSAIVAGDTLSSVNLDTDDEGVANALNSNAFRLLYSGNNVKAFKIGDLYGISFDNYTPASAAGGNGGNCEAYNLPIPNKTTMQQIIYNGDQLGHCVVADTSGNITFYTNGFYAYLSGKAISTTVLYMMI